MNLVITGAALIVGVLVGWLARTTSTSEQLRAAQVDAAQARARLDAERTSHTERLARVAADGQR